MSRSASPEDGCHTLKACLLSVFPTMTAFLASGRGQIKLGAALVFVGNADMEENYYSSIFVTMTWMGIAVSFLLRVELAGTGLAQRGAIAGVGALARVLVSRYLTLSSFCLPCWIQPDACNVFTSMFTIFFRKRQALQTSMSKIQQGRSKYNDAKGQYDQARSTYDEAKGKYEEVKGKVDEAKETSAKVKDGIDKAKDVYDRRCSKASAPVQVPPPCLPSRR
eukprot:3839759-Rhodomonas_salina.2